METTGIGSVPFLTVDTALAFAFRFSVPFLPQIPLRNSWEYMLPGALEGMPGLQTDHEGTVALDYGVWLGRSSHFEARLMEAFEKSTEPEAFAAFEPSNAASSCWQPFLWEVEEKGHKQAKVQIAGPLTAQWVLRLKDGDRADRDPGIGAQIFRLVLARATAMVRRLKRAGAAPILFLDEPGLFTLDPSNPRHVVGLQELKIAIQALKKEGVTVGLHCCSNTRWDAVLSLGLDFISIDTELSLDRVSKEPQLKPFLEAGGRMALGVIPSTWNGEMLASAQPEEILSALVDKLEASLGSDLTTKALRTGFLTPACGLALHSTTDAEAVLGLLARLHQLLE